MYDRIETELRGVQQALHSSRAVSTTSPPLEEPEMGDEPAQLRRIVDATAGRKIAGLSGPKASTRGNHRAAPRYIVREGGHL